jgi:hypothetical protein
VVVVKPRNATDVFSLAPLAWGLHQEMAKWFDAQPYVERYSPFGAMRRKLLSFGAWAFSS